MRHGRPKRERRSTRAPKKRANRAKSDARADGCVRDERGLGRPRAKKTSEPSEERRSSRRVRSGRARVGAPARQKKRANRAKSYARADGCVRDERGLGRPRAKKN